MINKSENAYDMVLGTLQDYAPDLNPSILMMDFEKASISSFHTNFPNAKQQCCYFHYMQCLWRNIQKEKELHSKCLKDCTFRYHVKYLGSLEFVPVEDVIPTYEIILHSKFYTENIPISSSFLQYYEETWKRSRRCIPFFQLSTWNVFEAVANRWARTNNNCKGFYRGFSSLLSGYHLSIWTFIEAIKKEQCLTDVKIEKIISGEFQNPSKKSRDKTESLLKIVTDYGRRVPIGYIKIILAIIEFID